MVVGTAEWRCLVDEARSRVDTVGDGGDCTPDPRPFSPHRCQYEPTNGIPLRVPLEAGGVGRNNEGRGCGIQLQVRFGRAALIEFSAQT